MKPSRKPVIEEPRPPDKKYDAEKHLRLFSDATSLELATTLGTLVGELDYALSSENPVVRERSTHIAIAAAERALGLARNLRYFSVHTRLHTQIIDLSQVVLDAVDLVEKELELNKIKIKVLAEASTYAHADTGAIQQIILNLLAFSRNSLPGGGQITLSLRQTEEYVEIRCHDNSPGIPEREMEQIFEPYVENVPLEKIRNLNLVVCRALTESHGGEINVESRIGVGTTVLIHLPFDPKLKEPHDFIEERRFKRIKVKLPVQIFFSRGQSTLQGELTTLSIGGCYATISDPQSQMLPELNDTVSVRIQHFGSEVLEVARGRVANVSWAGIHSGVGVEFMECDTHAKKLLEAIVKSHTL